MSRIFITLGSAYSKATNVNPVDGIWCSDCGWAGRVEYVPKFCPNCGVNLRKP